MISATTVRTRRVRWLHALCALLVAAVIGGCTIRLISDYDEAIDTKASELQKGMDAFLTHLEKPPGTMSATYGANKTFYATYAVDVRSLMVRAQAHPKNELSVQQYKLLLDSLGELEKAHQGEAGHEDDGTIPKEAIPTFRDLFNQSWAAIIRLEVAKKR